MLVVLEDKKLQKRKEKKFFVKKTIVQKFSKTGTILIQKELSENLVMDF